MKPIRIFRDLFGEDVTITRERWKHVCETHPELDGLIQKVGEALLDPDIVKLSRSDRQVRLYYKFFQDIMNGKYLIAVAKTEQPQFLVTAYLSDYIKAGEELWKRKS